MTSSNPHVRAERAIVLQLLCDDRPSSWRRVDLEAEAGIDQLVFLAVLASLTIAGVVILDRDVVVVSSCARHLDLLGLVAR